MKDKLKSSIPGVLVAGATATLSTLGTELVKWGVEALKSKFGPAPKDKSKAAKKEESKDEGSQN